MKPWYREPWPWILMAPPAAALAAGAATLWLAVSTSDGLVAEDYYRQGLAVNKLLAREEAARRLGVSAEIEFGAGTIRIRLKGEAPEALLAHLAHATRAGYDRRLRLARTAAGVYEAGLPPLAPGRWRISLEDPQGRWRIARDAP
jgi:hypothetical protein